MELGGVPQKIDEYFHWGLIVYVCNSARNWVSSMYKVPVVPHKAVAEASKIGNL